MAKKKKALTPADMKVLVISEGFPSTWGIADTLGEALKNATNPKYYQAFICTASTRVNWMGVICFDADFPPKLFHSVLAKKVDTVFERACKELLKEGYPTDDERIRNAVRPLIRTPHTGDRRKDVADVKKQLYSHLVSSVMKKV